MQGAGSKSEGPSVCEDTGIVMQSHFDIPLTNILISIYDNQFYVFTTITQIKCLGMCHREVIGKEACVLSSERVLCGRMMDLSWFD